MYFLVLTLFVNKVSQSNLNENYLNLIKEIFHEKELSTDLTNSTFTKVTDENNKIAYSVYTTTDRISSNGHCSTDIHTNASFKNNPTNSNATPIKIVIERKEDMNINSYDSFDNYKNEEYVNKIKDYLHSEYLIDLEKYITNKWKYVFNEKNKKHQNLKYTIEFNDFIKTFLNFDISLFCNMTYDFTTNLTDFTIFFDKVFNEFINYISKFNSLYKTFTDTDMNYINTKSITDRKKSSKNKRELIDVPFSILFEHKEIKLLQKLIPEFYWVNYLIAKETQRMILKKRLHSICTLLLLKLLFEKDRLFSMIKTDKNSKSVKEELLKYRTILFLALMNDPILLHNSFPYFMMLFINFADCFYPNIFTKQKIYSVRKAMLFNFQKFVSRHKREIIMSNHKYYIGSYYRIRSNASIIRKINILISKKSCFTVDEFSEVLDSYFEFYENSIDNEIFKLF